MRITLVLMSLFTVFSAWAQQSVRTQLMAATESKVDAAYDPNFIAETCRVGVESLWDKKSQIDVQLVAADKHTSRDLGSLQVELPLRSGVIAQQPSRRISYNGSALIEKYTSPDGRVTSVTEYFVDPELTEFKAIRTQTISDGKILLEFECSSAR